MRQGRISTSVTCSRDGALLASGGSGGLHQTAWCGNQMELDMSLADQPAVLQWPDSPMMSGRHQKMDPIQPRRDFETARDAARYAIENLPETVYRLATITVVGTPPFNSETWRAFCDVPDTPDLAAMSCDRRDHGVCPPQPARKTTFGEMRSSGVRGLLIYCADFRCSHSTAISADRWPDDVRPVRYRAVVRLPCLRQERR
jgi:hypothetical protein